MISVSHHAGDRRRQRCPAACHPEEGILLAASLVRRTGLAGSRTRKMGKPRYVLTATALWVIKGRTAVTVLRVSTEQLASILVWMLMERWV